MRMIKVKFILDVLVKVSFLLFVAYYTLEEDGTTLST